jgi:hypothetical protein
MLSKSRLFVVIAPDCRGSRTGEFGRDSRLIIPEVSRNRPAWEHDGWPEGSKRKGFQVLYDGREMKFVARTGEPSEPHPFETVVGLEMSKAHRACVRPAI